MQPVVLRCTTCTSSLVASEESVTARCPHCRCTFEMHDGRLHRVAFLQFPPRAGGEPDFYMPFRLFTVETTVQGTDEERVRAAQAIADDIRLVYVQAFPYRNTVDYHDWGLLLTSARHGDEAAVSHTDVPRLGVCSRTADTCFPYCRAFLTIIIDKRVDVTDLDIACRYTDQQIVAIPFSRRDRLVVDGLLEKSAPAVYFDGMPEET